MTGELIYRIAIITHVLAAVVWVGGVLFMGMIAVPTAKKLNDEQLRRKLLDVMGRRFRPVGWTALGLLVATGIYLMWHWGARWETVLDLSFFEHDHGRMLGYKLLLVLPMLVISALHDFWLGPRATDSDRSPEEIERHRRWAGVLGRITGVLVVVIVVVAVFVARPWI